MNKEQLSPDLSDLMTELAFLLVSRSPDEHMQQRNRYEGRQRSSGDEHLGTSCKPSGPLEGGATDG